MKVKQVSVFVENRPGRLKDMLGALSASEVNIRALSMADADDFGIVRMILSDSDKGVEALRAAGFTTAFTDVLRAEMPDVPGSLLKNIVEPLAAAGVNIEYIYASVDNPAEVATVIMKVNDVDQAARIIGQ